ncbi:MAG TPA: hypothetical protein VF272_02155 [Candidatus Saccharimonadia bacterium]
MYPLSIGRIEIMSLHHRLSEPPRMKPTRAQRLQIERLQRYLRQQDGFIYDPDDGVALHLAVHISELLPEEGDISAAEVEELLWVIRSSSKGEVVHLRGHNRKTIGFALDHAAAKKMDRVIVSMMPLRHRLRRSWGRFWPSLHRPWKR